MKKILCSVAVFGALMVGCGDGITDEMVKNYEKGLNENKNTFVQTADNGLNVNIPDFKCKKLNSQISCKTEKISIAVNGKQQLGIDEVNIKTSQVYRGSKKGEISISEAYNDMIKHGLSEEIEIKGWQFSQDIVGLATFLTMANPNLHALPAFLGNKYDIKVASKYSSKQNLLDGKATMTLHNLTKDMKLNIDFDHRIDYKKILKMVDELKISTFDVATQRIKQITEDIDYQNMAEQIQETVIDNVIFDKLNMIVSLAQLDEVKKGIDAFKEDLAFMSKAEATLTQTEKDLISICLKIIDQFEQSNPHKLTLGISYKDGLNISEIGSVSNGDIDTFLDNLSFKINDMELAKIFKTLIKEQEAQPIKSETISIQEELQEAEEPIKQEENK